MTPPTQITDPLRQKANSIRSSISRTGRNLQEEIQKEVDRIVTLSWRDRERVGHLDLKSLEIHLRTAMHEVGSTMLEKLLNSDGVRLSREDLTRE